MANKKDTLFSSAEGKLYSYKKAKAEIEKIGIDIEIIKNDYRRCSGIEIKEKSSRTYNTKSVVEIEVEEKERKVFLKEKEKRHKELLVEKIDNAMKILSEEEKKIVQYKYFSNNRTSWEYVGRMIGFSTSKCKQMRIEIIDKIKGLL
ncbi:RNA polymerase subunit sigma [Clostridioides difficile]|uniref:RNA polymerase subunit sigma n=1 Tax=Clostridioides difficile TaxID=1496 RepID=UPI001FAD33E4